MNHTTIPAKIKIPFPKESRAPRLICVEGIDGAGKSTQISLIKAYLQSINQPCILLREPSDLDTGKNLRAKLHGTVPLSAEEELDLFLIDRAADVQLNIQPALQKQMMVLMDRYLYSNVVYQGIALGLDQVLFANINQSFPFPGLTLYLDIEPRHSLERIQSRGNNLSYFEKLETLIKIRQNYLFLSEWDKSFITIDASQSIDAVFSTIKQKLNQYLNFFNIERLL